MGSNNIEQRLNSSEKKEKKEDAINTKCSAERGSWRIRDLDSWKLDRYIVQGIPVEMYGHCSSEHLCFLAGVLFFAEVVTMYFGWKIADVPGNSRDSSAVINATFAQLQSWVVGVPMWCFSEDSLVR